MDQIDEMYRIFKNAKQKEFFGELQAAIQLYLDAASYALNIYKQDQTANKKFESLAIKIVSHVKQVKSEIKSQNNSVLQFLDSDFPPPPQSDQLSSTEDDKITEISSIDQLLLISKFGSPILSYNFKAVDSMNPLYGNEVLFSGAMSAIYSIIQETIKSDIQKISLDGKNILIQKSDDLFFILISDAEEDTFKEKITTFADSFLNKFDKKISSALKNGEMISDDKECIEFIHTNLGF